MHELKNRVHTEIKEVLDHELTPKSVEVLGELVDIVKDIKYMEYLDCKIAHYAKEGTNRTENPMHDFIKDFRDYEIKRADYMKTKDASRKVAMQSSLSDMIHKHGDMLKDLWDLFGMDEEKEIIRKLS